MNTATDTDDRIITAAELIAAAELVARSTITANPPPEDRLNTTATNPPPEDRLITAAELAARWGVSRAHIYNSLHLGLPSIELGRARRFRIATSDRWLEDQQNDHPGDAA